MAGQEYAQYLFHQGTNAHAADLLGCHREGKGLVFRTWAPTAQSVCLIGSFNDWKEDELFFTRVTDNGLWELHTENYPVYSSYKFLITTADGRRLYKADPYAFHAETAPYNASKIFHLDGYRWGDSVWQRRTAKADIYSSPVNIYEVNTVSWLRNEDGSVLSYEALADRLIPYVKKMGYTHVELMPITEYPFEGSWGYQVTGYFAPTSRHGDPHSFMRMVDRFHQAGVGVLLDWVPAHFTKDAHGLYEFDGRACYEYSDPRKQEHREWGTRIFDYGRNEVVSFLISSALFWLKEYHIDGLRVDAVASMIYLDYAREPGDWTPNIYGGRENLEAVALFQNLSRHVFEEHPGTMLIAEESTSWPMVTKPVHDGGLGFNFKWNMGWMNDVLDYTATDPVFRGGIHNKLTFSFFYAFSENFILPFSHDEVVHGKRSLIGKMPGTYEQKFAGLRALMGYMIGHPGKKLLFMGGEYAQFSEWDEKKSLEWFMLDYPAHKAHQEYVARLNEFYLRHSELWEIDFDWKGFEWLVSDDTRGNTLVFRRMNKKGDSLICVCCFSGEGKPEYRFGVPEPGTYTCLFSSEDGEGKTYQTEPIPSHGREVSLSVPVSPLSVSFYKRTKKPSAPRTRTAVSTKKNRKDGSENVH